MNNRFAAPVASAATAILLLGACGDDDDSTTTHPSQSRPSEPAADLAKGEDVETVGDVTSGLRNQTLNIDAHQQAGEATGEFRFDDNVIRVDCAETILDGHVVLGGQRDCRQLRRKRRPLRRSSGEGDPDSVALFHPMNIQCGQVQLQRTGGDMKRIRAMTSSGGSPEHTAPRLTFSLRSKTAPTSRPATTRAAMRT